MIVGGSYGAGNYGMCGRAFSPRFLFTWPNARISVMGGEQAARCSPPSAATISRRKAATGRAEEEEAFKAPVRERYEAEGNPLLRHGAALGRRHHPAVGDARRAGAGARGCLNAPIEETRFGVFRM